VTARKKKKKEEIHAAPESPAKPRPARSRPLPKPKEADAPWSSWMPSPNANIEIRWQTRGAAGKTEYLVEVFAVTFMAPVVPPLSRPRQPRPGLGFRAGPVEAPRPIKQLIARRLLRRGERQLPFSLYAPRGPVPLFQGVLEVEDRRDPRETAKVPHLVIRSLVYDGGEVTEEILAPTLNPAAAEGEP